MRLSGLSRLSRLSAVAFIALCATIATADYTMPPLPEAPANLKAAEQSFKAFVGAVDKTKAPYAVAIPWLEELKATPPYSTNSQYRLIIDKQILGWCCLTYWANLGRYNADYCNAKIVELCKAVLADPALTLVQKETFVSALIRKRASDNDFTAAEKIAREHIARAEALNPPDPRAVAGAWLLLSDVFALQERPTDMVAAIERARRSSPLFGTQGGTTRAFDFGGLDKIVDMWWGELDRPYEEALFFAEKGWQGRRRKVACDYILCPTNHIRYRVDLLQRYFMADNGADARAARQAIGRETFKGFYNWRGSGGILTAFNRGDYQLAVDILDDISASGVPAHFATPNFTRIHIAALGALGRYDEAAALARAHEADKGNSPLDILKYQVYAAILSGTDALPLVEQSSCARKDKIEATLDAVRMCQIWDKLGVSEKYCDAYMKYFAPPPKRVAKVVWSDKAVGNITDWRALADGLESHVCDLPFKASLDFLETDVATGREKVTFEEGAKPTRMAFQTVADRDALHLFLRVEDAESRRVESGAKGGVRTEMYLAPGDDQPYTTFGSNPRDGISWDFPTSYQSADHKRIDRTPLTGRRFRSEVAFSDDDYVLHIVLPWDDFYQKLPSPKATWRFECISWCPDGGYTWGGSVGIHNVSRWGTLEISLSPKQLTEIRRGILLRALPDWRKHKYVGPFGALDYFETWADREIGDPAFYAECLKPLQEELVGYAKRIKPDMPDDDVNEVYEKGLVRIKGLKYEIDRLRREYLERKMTE
jgi:hypothetical protein